MIPFYADTENIGANLFTSSCAFEDAVKKIDLNVQAYNAALGDLGLVLVSEIRNDVRKVEVLADKTFSNVQDVQAKVDNLPSRIVEVLSESRFLLKIPTSRYNLTCLFFIH